MLNSKERDLLLLLQQNSVSAEAWQMGGNNTAIGIRKNNSQGYYLITFDILGKNEYLLGEYNSEGEWLEQNNKTTYNEAEMIDYVLKSCEYERLA